MDADKCGRHITAMDTPKGDSWSVINVWRTPDRLNTDDATIAYLVGLASRDSRICDIIENLVAGPPGNGSVWASGTARVDGTEALLKLGARRAEREWMVAVSASTDNVVPRIFGSGELNGVGWLVLERCPYDLDRDSPAHLEAVIASVARCHHAAASVSAATFAMDVAWLRANLEGAREQGCPGDVDAALASVETDWAFVEQECGIGKNHGDVHFGNVVARSPDGPALLIDPMPMATVWALDAADLQLTSGHPGIINGLACARRELALPTADDLAEVERFVLGWTAARWWRIAPWRHTNERWRATVERLVDGLGT